MTTERTRDANGLFVRHNASADNPSLEKYRIRQRKFVARRFREKKRIMSTFLASFVIKEQDKEEHWMPGLKKDSLLLGLMESLIKGKFLEARRSRFGDAKKIFFKHVSNAIEKRLPRIRVYPADKLLDKQTRVAAFVGWRFPSPTDSFEMDTVDTWLRKHESKLRVSVAEAKKVSVDFFRRYVRRPKRFMFVGYPSTKTRECSSPTLDLTPNEVDLTSNDDTVVLNTGGYAIQHQSNMTSSERHASTTQPMSPDALISGSRELMKVASTDFYYRSLLLILNPTCSVRLDAVCYAWMQEFKEGEPQEEWCGLMKDIFHYCRLVAKRETAADEYRNLKADLTQELSMFKLIRSSASLPLFECSSSLIGKAFDRRDKI